MGNKRFNSIKVIYDCRFLVSVIKKIRLLLNEQFHIKEDVKENRHWQHQTVIIEEVLDIIYWKFLYCCLAVDVEQIFLTY